MPTTSNFGWNTPADTDLVKDGALAIRTLGNNIDASMADLKGGTTGQVLSKNSNTDMDFTWVTSDDANAIQNAIVDAKGDLITATAADTPARLAVGSNNLYLVADAAQSTGLKWEGAISSWTPTWNGITLGNGTVVAEYQRMGNVVFCYIYFKLGSTSAVTGDVYFSLPIGSSKRPYYNGTAYYLDDGIQTAGGTIEFSGSNGFFRLSSANLNWQEISWTLSATRPFTWGTNDLMAAYFWYEVA